MKLPLHGPRAVRIRPEFLFNVIVAEVALGGIFLLATLVFVDSAPSVREIKTQGKPVQGTVATNRVNAPPRPNQTAFELPYRYRVGGKAYTGKATVRLETFYNTPADAPVTVWYLPGRPEVSTLGSALEQAGPPPIRLLLFGLAGTIGITTLALRAVALRERKILREWTALPVTIARVQERRIGDYVEYETALAEHAGEPPRQWTFITRSSAPADEEGRQTQLLLNPVNPRQVRRIEHLRFVESHKEPASYD